MGKKGPAKRDETTFALSTRKRMPHRPGAIIYSPHYVICEDRKGNCDKCGRNFCSVCKKYYCDEHIKPCMKYDD